MKKGRSQSRLAKPERWLQVKAVGRPRVIFDRKEVVNLRNEGLSWSQIAARLGVSIGTARRACRDLTAGLVTPIS